MTPAIAALAVAVSFTHQSAVPFQTVARGDGATSAVTERTVRAIRTDAAWRTAWRRLHRGELPAPRRPRVDFRRRTLVLVTTGRRPTGGHDVTVRSIRRTRRGLAVGAEERAPGRGCFVTQAHTAPFRVVSIRRTAARASSTWRRRVVDCPP